MINIGNVLEISKISDEISKKNAATHHEQLHPERRYVLL